MHMCGRSDIAANEAPAMSILQRILLFLCFFPSITFGIISAEIFPWAILFFIVSIRIANKNDTLLTVALFFLLFLSAASSIITNPESDATRSLAAYINPIAAFIAFLNMPAGWVERSVSLAKKILIVLLALGIAQYIGLTRPFETILQSLVPRASGGALLDFGGRGVTLLSSEPSRAGVELVFLYFIWRLTQPPSAGRVAIDLTFVAYIVLFIKAAQPAAFAVITIGIFLMRRPMHLVPLVFAAMLASLIEFGPERNRILLLLSNIFSSGSVSDTLMLLVNAAGPRLVSIYAFFTWGIFNPFGSGIGSWPVSSVAALDASGVDLSQISYFQILGAGNSVEIRGSGLLTNLMLDVGVFGTMLFLLWIFAVTRRHRKNDRITLIVMSILLLKIAFVGSIGEPLPWIAAALVLRFNVIKKRRTSATFCSERNAMPVALPTQHWAGARDSLPERNDP